MRECERCRGVRGAYMGCAYGVLGVCEVCAAYVGYTYEGTLQGGGVRTGGLSHEEISHRVYFAQWPENPEGKFYCLRQVHLAENLLQATHIQNREKTT